MTKIIDLTPAKYACGIAQCPAVFKTENQTYLIIGKLCVETSPTLQGRVGPGEVVVEISAELLEGALASQVER